MWRAAFTELVATACLLFTVTISIISCLESNVSEPKLLVPFAVFIVAFLLLLTTVPLSGGHMSPVFTLSFFYVLAQCTGSILAYAMIKSVINKSYEEKYWLGGCVVDGNGKGVSPWTALMVEFSCTFLVLFVAVTVGFDKRRSEELGLKTVCAVLAGAMGVAFYVSMTVTGTPGYGGVGLNPARCLGPALLVGGRLWYGYWVFWVGPGLACIVYHGVTLLLPRELVVVDNGGNENGGASGSDNSTSSQNFPFNYII
ncbi:hypothetical protein K2173_017917 [Erythroxylum novogranatense]|uniref:Uncharacterized protein n=1 Tax=Erythroxylum novogranatense TaxID=1862640 RepID=A0AAV8TMZ7_9ROSI|nr:hypothetical protein K2173_017917 [Erythroxylum novogranatense]